MKKGNYYSLNDYTITRDGNIMNKHNGRKLKPQPNGKGYLRVIIGKKRYFVATTRGHITAIIDNVIVDTFDCSDRILDCCWQIM